MVEVFKTNVTDPGQAEMLVNAIHGAFLGYKANFDLQDCDHILRVASAGFIHPDGLLRLVQAHGFQAEVLPGDDYPVAPAPRVTEPVQESPVE